MLELVGMSAIEAEIEMSEQRSRSPLPPRDELLAMHRTMVRIRLFEERVKTDYLARKMPGFTHSYVGEEAVAAGGCAALEPGDSSPRPTAATATPSPRASASDR